MTGSERLRWRSSFIKRRSSHGVEWDVCVDANIIQDHGARMKTNNPVFLWWISCD